MLIIMMLFLMKYFNSNKVRLRPLERKVEKDNVIQEV